MGEDLLFVNSYPRSGIGDFGGVIRDNLVKKELYNLCYIETSPAWHVIFRIWKKSINAKNKLIFNIGFTSFGVSPLKNFSNFVFIGFISFFRRKRVSIVLHDSPEIIDSSVSGFAHFNLLKTGGRIVAVILRWPRIEVFSVDLFNILKEKHRLRNVLMNSFPCRLKPTRKRANEPAQVMVIHVGYISEYKGLNILTEVKRILPDVKFAVIGGGHTLHSDANGKNEYFGKLSIAFDKAGIDLPGYVPEEELSQILTNHKCIGILPYISTSGSSYSAAYLIERGIPIVTSNLPEFRKIEVQGAGLLVVNRNPTSFADALKRLILDKNLYQKLVDRNINYCKKNSMERFVEKLLN